MKGWFLKAILLIVDGIWLALLLFAVAFFVRQCTMFTADGVLEVLEEHLAGKGDEA